MTYHSLNASFNRRILTTVLCAMRQRRSECVHPYQARCVINDTTQRASVCQELSRTLACCVQSVCNACAERAHRQLSVQNGTPQFTPYLFVSEENVGSRVFQHAAHLLVTCVN
ncbi:hypothetical protein J6590_027935 [Homalodisca vitripennis]|nr:hypothetical protein J6590_027935 [Homalodisca vitripennis]